MRKVLVWLAAVLIGVPLILFGLARGASWYLVSDQAKKLARSLNGHVELDYARADSALGGPIVVRDVRIRPRGINDQIHIGRAVIKSEGYRDWYRLMRLLFEGRLPERLEVDLESIRLAADGEIARRLGQLELWPLVAPYAALGCFEDGRFDREALAELRAGDGNGRFSYALDRSTSAVNLVWRYAVPRSGSLVLDATIAKGSSRLPFTVSEDPQLKSLSFVVVDDAFHLRRNEICARRLGMAPEDAAVRHADALLEKLAQLGIPTGPVTREALREFAIRGGEISLSATPLQPLPLSAYIPSDRPGWAAAMHLEKRREGALVTEAASVAKEHALSALLARAIEAEKNEPDKYRPVPLADLPKFPQKPLRVHTRDGRVLNGYLERYQGQALVLTQHLTGGRASFVLPFSDIEKVYVLY
jgi:hypothetical protein